MLPLTILLGHIHFMLRHVVASLSLLLPGTSAAGQSIRGTVTAVETGLPLSLSIVALIPGGARRFTDGRGAFTFDGLTAGSYVLSVRQIGYTPLDTQIVVPGSDPLVMAIALHHLAIELPPVTVAARACTNPGPPDSTDAALAAIFDQLQENARRFELLANSYPFRFRLERTFRYVNRSGDSTRPTVDRLELGSADEPPYEPGRVVTPAWGPWRADLLVRTTTLSEFANKTFVKNHCFRLAGRDTIEGQTLVRIDFEPATRIPWADMAGSVYLDSLTYQVRYTETSLTHPERTELRDVQSIVARTSFREIAPGIPLQDYMRAVTIFRFGGRRSSVEVQRLVEIHFRRGPPGGPQ